MIGDSTILGSPFAVVVFGDGTLPEILLCCSQFRLVADLLARDRATSFQVVQLHRHLERSSGCRPCRSYLLGRIVEVSGRAWQTQPARGELD